jgi:Holliday junction resolvase
LLKQLWEKMTNYAKGSKYERKARDDLEREGYAVMRSAASHTPIDIIAVGEHFLKLIQVKSTKRRIVSVEAVMNKYKEDIQQLQAMPAPPYVMKELWLWEHRKGWRTFLIEKNRVIENNGTIRNDPEGNPLLQGEQGQVHPQE